MELFHESKNKYFHLVFHLLNMSQQGIKATDFIDIVDDIEYDEKLIGKDYKDFKGFLLNEYEDKDNLNLFIKDGDNIYPKLNSNNGVLLNVRFQDIEKKWLKALLKQPLPRVLLGEKLCTYLDLKLKDVDYDYHEKVELTNESKSKMDFKKVDMHFWNILYAIKNNKLIKYCNNDKDGIYHKDNVALPLRIEYSINEDKLRVSFYEVNEKRNILMVLDRIEKAEVLNDAPCPISRSEAIELLKKNKYIKNPIVIELTDIRQAMERFFMTFSAYERYTKYLGEDKYEIKIYYYSFEEEEVLRKIISLGPYVVVKSPQDVVNRVVEKIKKGFI